MIFTKLWYIITNAKKFKVVSPNYISRPLTYKDALFMEKIIPLSRIILIK